MLLAASLLKDINALTPSSNPNSFVDLNGTLLFRANDGVHGQDWWRSDGTPAGTRLVKDTGSRQNWLDPSLAPRTFAAAGNNVFFAGDEPATGTELWKTDDSTDAGTVLVKDLLPGTGSAAPAYFVALGDAVFFSERTNLWKSDGTPEGTVLVKDFGLSRTRPKPLAVVGGRVLLEAAVPSGEGAELWTTDGTPEGTVLLKDIFPGRADSEPGVIPTGAPPDTLPLDQFFVTGGRMYFAATDAEHGRELWQTDGTPEGTRLVTDAVPGPAGSFPGFIMENGGQVYFTANDPTTYRLDVFRVAPDVGPATLIHTEQPGRPIGLASDGNDLFLVAWGSQVALYALDDAGSAFAELREFGSAHAVAPSFFRVGAWTYFGVGSGPTPAVPTYQLWRTDGTPAGTTSVSRLTSTSAQPELVRIGDVLYFPGGDAGGSEPWRSDGTPEGTRRLFDVNASPTRASNPTRPVEVNGHWLFAATDNSAVINGSIAPELWMTDATEAGTRKLIDPATGNGFAVSAEETGSGSQLSTGTVWNGRLYFAGTTQATGAELFSSDGTAEGTGLIADLYPGPDPSNPGNFAPYHGRLYFVTKAYLTHSWALWSTDGTAAGTSVVKQLAFISPSDSARLTVAGDTLYFAASNGTDGGGAELWKTDGTEEGTVRVKDIYPGVAGSEPTEMTAFNGLLYFNARGTLWRSDGTEAGTVSVQSSAAAASPRNLTVLNGRLLFEAAFSYGYGGIWGTDGTPEGTQRLTPLDFAPDQIAMFHLIEAGGVAYFFRQQSRVPPEMWRTDGTPEGTTLVKTFDTTIYPPLATPVGTHGSVVYVRAGDFDYGWAGKATVTELWQSDGTPAVTAKLFSGGRGANPDNAVFVNGAVLFTADDGVHGNEPWVARLPRVVGRQLIYNNSAFDGKDAEPNAGDDAAIATDKAALLPGQGPATFSSASSYSRGINGIMIDVSGGLPMTALAGIAAAATFKLSSGGDGAAWSDGPAPSRVAIRPGAGVGGSDRITLLWPDNAIRNKWLQVTVHAPPASGLAGDDLFYFGHLAGESGDSSAALRVNALDIAGVKRELSPVAAGLTSPVDFNRDGRVNALDVALARANLGASLGTLAVPLATSAAALSPRRVWDETKPGPL